MPVQYPGGIVDDLMVTNVDDYPYLMINATRAVSRSLNRHKSNVSAASIRLWTSFESRANVRRINTHFND